LIFVFCLELRLLLQLIVSQMQEGYRVELQGSEGSHALNGSHGTIVGYKGDRMIVTIDGSGNVRLV
jgi:hypothetical protein